MLNEANGRSLSPGRAIVFPDLLSVLHQDGNDTGGVVAVVVAAVVRHQGFFLAAA